MPISIDIEDIPDEESERRNSTLMNDKNKRLEENKNKEPVTAPDSLGSRTDSTRVYYRPEIKQNSGRIVEKITDDMLFSPES